MQLSFIWIENFRNFQNLELNFNSQGSFSYRNNELSYQENLNYVSNFFHENILDITGIVGKNGSGKSNILELINYIFRNSKSEIKSKFFFIINDNNNNYCYTNNLSSEIDNKTKLKIEERTYEGTLKEFSNIYFSNVFDYRKCYFSDDIIDLSTNKFIRSSFGQNIHSHHQEEVRAQVQFITSRYFSEIQNIDLKTPSNLVFSNQVWIAVTNKIKAYEMDHKIIGLKEFVKKYKTRLQNAKSEESFFYFTSFLIFIYYFFEPYSESKNKTEYHLTERNVVDLNFITKEMIDGNFDIKELHYFITINFSNFLERNNREKKLVQFLRKELSHFDSHNWKPLKTKSGQNKTGRNEFSLPFENLNCQEFIKSYFQAVGNRTMFNFEWGGGISSGQVAFINLFSRFHSTLHRVKHKQVLICIDEGDLYFHPKWQLEFVNYIVKIMPILFGSRKLQIILTTHSPFLVSDLPKSNLIFLGKSNDSEIIETFSANIHALYSNSFFLENGTISEFAYQKLKQIKSNLSRSNKIAVIEARKIINQIGEPIIKKQFEKYLE